MSKVKSALVAMFTEKAQIAIKLKAEIASAETELKKEFLTKKLTKNNNEAQKILQALAKIPAEQSSVTDNEATSKTLTAPPTSR